MGYILSTNQIIITIMKNVLKLQKEIPQESFFKMMSSSEITSDDVITMLGLMVEYIEDKDASGKPICKPYSPIGEGFDKPKVCKLKITDLSYVRMRDENLLDLEGEFAFVLNNEVGETIVWPILSKMVYVFYENPFELKTFSWYRFMCVTTHIITKDRELGHDWRLSGKPMVTQHDKGFRVFRVTTSKISAKQDYVESMLTWKDMDIVENCTRYYQPLWLLRNEPEKLKPQKRALSPLPPYYGMPCMGEIDE